LTNILINDIIQLMITKKDLDSAIDDAVGRISGAIVKTLENFATKEDLKNFAIKDDLKNFATKDDFKSFATKEDLKSLATKDDLNNFATKDDLKEELKITNRKIDILYKTAPTKAEVKEHGKRISRLEKAVFATP